MGRELKLRARQRNPSGGYVEVSVSFTPTACGSARLAEAEPVPVLSVMVLGNPIRDNEVNVEIRNAAGQPLRFLLTNLRGQVVSEQRVEQAGVIERQRISVANQPAGLLLLRVSTPTQTQTVKLLKTD